MYTVILVSIIILLLYIYYNPNIVLREKFTDLPKNMDDYKIPLPNFKIERLETQKMGELRKNPNKQPVKPPVKKPIEIKKLPTVVKKKDIEIRQIMDQDVCQFVSTFKIGDKCPAEYPVYTGASFSANPDNISCGNTNIMMETATGIAKVDNGKITGIQLLKNGSHYVNPPTITIEGNGKGAKATAIVNDGRVVSVILENGGENYTSTPNVIFSKPDTKLYCKLCCKNEL